MLCQDLIAFVEQVRALCKLAQQRGGKLMLSQNMIAFVKQVRASCKFAQREEGD